MHRFSLVAPAVFVSAALACQRSPEAGSGEARPEAAAPAPPPVPAVPARSVPARSATPRGVAAPAAARPAAAPGSSPGHQPVAEAPAAAGRFRDEAQPPGPRPAVSVVGAPNDVEPKVVRGPAVTADHYTAYLQTTGRYVPGTPGSVLAIVAAAGDYKCNERYPTRFSAAGGSGVAVSSPVRGVLAGRQGSLVIPVQVKESGPATVSGRLEFSVCSEDRCLLETQDLRLSFDVP